MRQQKLSKLETESKTTEISQPSYRPEGYEKPMIKRHAIIMTMAPQGSKMGHGLFPFATRKSKENYYAQQSPYRRT